MVDSEQHGGISRERLDALARLNEVFREEGREACLAAICAEEDRLVVGPGDSLKQFSATWDASFGFVGSEIRSISAFGQGNGYSSEDLAAINALAVGQTWKDGAYGESHTVTRLPDLLPTAAPPGEDAPSRGESRPRMRM
jgi:hypothetical protein